MKFDLIITSNHSLKKNGYRIIRKLHKLEKKKGAERAYKAIFEETYFFVLTCSNLVNIIDLEYIDSDNTKWIKKFKEKSEAFINYLETIALKKSRMDKKILSSYLKAYTKFFNKIISSHYIFELNEEIMSAWNDKCVMAYIATWGNN